MSTPTKVRSRSYRDRRRTENQELGLIEITIRSPEGSTEVMHVFRDTLLDLHKLKYGENGENEITLEKFLTYGSPNPHLFEIDGSGQLAVNLIPFRSMPILFSNVTTLEKGIERKEFLSEAKELFPILRRIFELERSKYNWNSHDYRELCNELNINPDYNRPEFAIRHRHFAEDLIEVLITNSTLDRDTSFHNFLMNVIDYLRIDDGYVERVSRYNLLHELERFTERLGKGLYPDYNLIKDFLDNPPNHYKEDSCLGAIIEVLPCPVHSGHKYIASTSLSDSDRDGFPNNLYREIKGIAVLPESTHPWTSTVVKKLKAKGVMFLTDKELDNYKEREEPYWCWKHGIAGNYSYHDSMLWNLFKPKTPISDRFMAMANAASILHHS